MAGPAPIDLHGTKATFLLPSRGHGGLYKLQAWDLDKELLGNIVKARKPCQISSLTLIFSYSMSRVHSTDYEMLKVSPDSCLQMAFS